MRITCLQIERNNRPKKETIDQVFHLIDKISETDLLILPEIWATGFFRFDAYAKDAEPLDGPLFKKMATKAKERNTFIMMGSFIESDENDLYNTSILIDNEGTLVARYRKIHLFGYESQERSLLTPGNDVIVVDMPWGLTGLSTCYDLRFPELFRLMLDLGAKFFIVTSAWPLKRVEAWNLFCRTRAHENLSYLIACNCSGSDQGIEYAGTSQIVDPYGRVIVQCGQEEKIITASIDPDLVERARNEFPAIDDRRLIDIDKNALFPTS